MWSPEKLVHCLRSLSGSTWSHMEESWGKKWGIGHLQILLRREVRRNDRSILTRESLTSSDYDLWELRFFWRKPYMWSLGRPVLDTSYKENMSGRRVFNNKILSGEKFVFFSFLLLLLLKKLWWKPNCVWYVRRGGGNEGEGEQRQCVVRCGMRGLKAREDQKDKTSTPSHFHVFTLSHSLLKMRKINSNLSSTK